MKCETCKFWRKVRDVDHSTGYDGVIWKGPHGECRKIDDLSTNENAWLHGDESNENEELILITKPDFGCTLYQKGNWESYCREKRITYIKAKDISNLDSKRQHIFDTIKQGNLRDNRIEEGVEPTDEEVREHAKRNPHLGSYCSREELREKAYGGKPPGGFQSWGDYWKSY